jgi:predicted dienelactone hydrolase
MHASNKVCRFLSAISFCLTAPLAQAAGLQSIDIPADADGPAMHGAIWYPCVELPGKVPLDPFTMPGVKDYPLLGDKLPLVVVSHGRGGNFAGHRDTDVLAFFRKWLVRPSE